MLLTRRSQFLAEDADDISPKFKTLDRELAEVGKSAYSDSEREDIDSDEELDLGPVDKDDDFNAIPIDQPSRASTTPAGDDGDALMDDDDSDDDLFPLGAEGPEAKNEATPGNLASIERLLTLHLEDLRAMHTEALARVDALLKAKTLLSDQFASINAAISARTTESSLRPSTKTTKTT